MLSSWLGGCGGGGAGGGAAQRALPAASAPAAAPAGASVSGTVALSIPLSARPGSAGNRRPAFVAPNASSVQVTVNGGTPTVDDVSPSSPLCTTGASARTCTIALEVPPGNATVAIAIYDGPNAGGNVIGGGTASGTIVANQPFAFTINASPAVGSVTNPVLTYASGSTFVSGTPAIATVALTVLDPDGNAPPPGSFTSFLVPLGLTTNDPHVTVSPASWTSPAQAVTLVYDGNTAVAPTVTLTATANARTVGALPLTVAVNQLVNGNAEASVGAPDTSTIDPPSGWTTTGQFTAVQYGASGGFPDSYSPGPIDRAINLFAGGNAAVSTASQTVDLSAFQSAIDAGTKGYALTGWLGGYANQDDNVVVSVTFRNATGAPLGSAVSIGPVTAAMRSDVTGLLFQSTSGLVPPFARSAQVTITATRVSGVYNDGYCDDIALDL